jgi:hypothetical protein
MKMSNMTRPSSPHIHQNQLRKPRVTNLEMANQMFKDAFLVKKTRFSHLHPELSEQELHKMTAEYFRNLPDSDGKRGEV